MRDWRQSAPDDTLDYMEQLIQEALYWTKHTYKIETWYSFTE